MTKTEELESVLSVVRATLDNALRQNETLINGYKFYADRMTYQVPAGRVWRPIDRDEGERAREILREVIGYE